MSCRFIVPAKAGIHTVIESMLYDVNCEYPWCLTPRGFTIREGSCCEAASVS
jgi:hypothetical protein